jgi:hypothetical protein
MTWRQLFARRPQWWIDLAARLRQTTGSGSESSSSDERARFWKEFRAGQREADLRVLEDRKILTPCPENDAPK